MVQLPREKSNTSTTKVTLLTLNLKIKRAPILYVKGSGCWTAGRRTGCSAALARRYCVSHLMLRNAGGSCMANGVIVLCFDPGTLAIHPASPGFTNFAVLPEDAWLSELLLNEV